MKSAAQVALEVGSSQPMIFEHYRELVTEKAAKAWFGIAPEAVKALQVEREKRAAERDQLHGHEDKVIRLPMAAVAA